MNIVRILTRRADGTTETKTITHHTRPLSASELAEREREFAEAGRAIAEEIDRAMGPDDTEAK